jgi:hypothetical protein
MKLILCSLLWLLNAEISPLLQYGEKLTLLGVLSLGIYVLYKRDVSKEKKFDELQLKVFELEKTHIEAINLMTNAIEQNTAAMRELLEKKGKTDA